MLIFGMGHYMAIRLRTALPAPLLRSVSARAIGETAALYEAGGVDDMATFDQSLGWFPRALWKPEYTPWAALASDQDSFHDWSIATAVAAMATTKLRIVCEGTDSIRNGPGELLIKLLSLLDLSDGRVVCGIGTGELKQVKPFGYLRKEGLARLDDLLRIIALLLDCDGPISYEGNHWNLKNAYVGTVRKHRPEFWIMGNGPTTKTISAQLANGIVGVAPMGAARPERWAEQVESLTKEIVANDRDPDAFTFGLAFQVLCSDDPNIIENAINSPLMRFHTSIGGRSRQADWRDEGLEPIMPENYHYALHYLPQEQTEEGVHELIAKVPRKMVEKTYIIGNPEECAAQIAQYVDAGCNWLSIWNLLPYTLDPEAAQAHLALDIELCNRIKALADSTAIPV